jgi:cation diffusion facilitator family transporter
VPGLRLAWGNLLGNLALAGLKVAGGLLFNSQAVFADGVHSLSDAAGAGAVLYGRRMAADPPDEEHPYGHEKAESVAAFVVGLLLALAGLSVAGDAAQRLLRGAPTEPGWPALAVAALGIVVKEVLYRVSARGAADVDSAGLRATAADSRADVWTSAVALLGVLLARLGLRWADPAMALVVSALLVFSGLRLARLHLHELLEGRSAQIDGVVRRAALGVPGVLELHGLRTRAMGPYVLVDLKIGVDGDMSVTAGHEIAQGVVAAVHRAAPQVREVLVHVNPARRRREGAAGQGEAPVVGRGSRGSVP